MAKAQKASEQGFNWKDATHEQLTEAFGLLYPDLGVEFAAQTKKDGLIVLVTRAAKGRDLATIRADYEKMKKERLSYVDPGVQALSFPDGLQDILDRLGTRTNLAEKYADPAIEWKAYREVDARLKRLKISLAAAKAMPIKPRGAAAVGFSVIGFAIDDDAYADEGTLKVLAALQELDEKMMFGRGKGKRPVVKIKLPNVTGDRVLSILLDEEYELVDADEGDEEDEE